MNDSDEETAVTPARASFDHRQRIKHDLEGLVEDLVREGQDNGAFDNLKGAGQPLNLRKPIFGAEKDLAHQLLKDNDLKPAWISNRGDILQACQALRDEMSRVWLQHEQEYSLLQGQGNTSLLIISWDDACLKWEKRIAALNKQIDNFNLKRPVNNLELYKLTLENELERIGARRWLKKYE